MKYKKSRKHYLIDVTFTFIIGYFLYYGIFGENGAINLNKINIDLKAAQETLKNLEREREQLVIRNNGLYEKSLNLDLLEEQVKKSLGYARRNEVVVLFE